ncbi:hypothetical protein RYH80_17050 [Halobaculum sp. MBLA0147]|uniref:hypothetical protein n=1 Tax=Halobaculum sp. MBLA0147 TaxID=3079934 RepID=UPI0035248C14
MHRRAILAAVGGAIGLAGCTGGVETTLRVEVLNSRERAVPYELSLSRGGERIVTTTDEVAGTSADDDGADTDELRLGFDAIRTRQTFVVEVETETATARKPVTLSCRARDGGAYLSIRFHGDEQIIVKSSDCRGD